MSLNRITRIWVSLVFFTTVSVTLAAQTEPELVSSSVPFYPRLAREYRREGVVKIGFTLRGNETEPSSIVVKSGDPLLASAALENVKTWRFSNPYTVARKYETTITYRVSDSQSTYQRIAVTFDSFERVEVITSSPYSVEFPL